MKRRSLVVLTILLAAVVPRQAAGQRAESVPSLRAGAARVDITPSQGELPKNSRGILDRLYARAIVLENGVSTAALITIDAGAVPDALWQAVTGQIEQELKIPAASVLLTATHTHSAGGQRGPDYVQKIVESVRLAQQRLTPARMGYGTGVLVHQRQSSDHRPEDQSLVGGPELRGAVGQDRRRARSSRARTARRSPSTTTTPCTR